MVTHHKLLPYLLLLPASLPPGLTVAQNYKRGQQLIQDREFADLAEFFQARACAA